MGKKEKNKLSATLIIWFASMPIIYMTISTAYIIFIITSVRLTGDSSEGALAFIPLLTIPLIPFLAIIPAILYRYKIKVDKTILRTIIILFILICAVGGIRKIIKNKASNTKITAYQSQLKDFRKELESIVDPNMVKVIIDNESTRFKETIGINTLYIFIRGNYTFDISNIIDAFDRSIPIAGKGYDVKIISLDGVYDLPDKFDELNEDAITYYIDESTYIYDYYNSEHHNVYSQWGYFNALNPNEFDNINIGNQIWNGIGTTVWISISTDSNKELMLKLTPHESSDRLTIYDAATNTPLDYRKDGNDIYLLVDKSVILDIYY
ncbi:MAG: hypothetical protein GX366_00030 [Epulopiscium sp.]|nr:hypothetical protein [Candidatus Epulonipiscium sp.]